MDTETVRATMCRVFALCKACSQVHDTGTLFSTEQEIEATRISLTNLVGDAEPPASVLRLTKVQFACPSNEGIKVSQQDLDQIFLEPLT